jgi:hypothetical protein
MRKFGKNFRRPFFPLFLAVQAPISTIKQKRAAERGSAARSTENV